MRIATYNVEWFSNLFEDDGTPQRDGQWSGRRDVERGDQLDALGAVFTALDADAVMIIEAPDSHAKRSGVAALEQFARLYGLRTDVAIQGFINQTQQEIALLYDPAALTVTHDPQGAQTGKHGAPDAPRFDSVFRLDLDVDAAPELVRWSKPPLELAATTASGFAFRIIGVHAKSKAPHGARGHDAVMRVSIENRRKQLAQCVWLRQRVDQHLNAGEPIMVLGDFNDGPGLDEYEKLFGRSGVEIVLGTEDQPRLFDPHAAQALSRPLGAAPTTARFFVAHQRRWLQALLDYVMVSEDLRARGPEWRIWHPFDDANCFADAGLREALLTASDHFPVTIDLDI